jgi:diguanylate cyclase (GGDEF)-like protein
MNYANIPLNSAKPMIGDQQISPIGYATLRLNIKVDDIDKAYGIKLRYFSAASKIWINGKLIDSVGVVGTSKETYVPQYLPNEVVFTSDKNEIELVIQVSNYHHRRAKLNDVLFGTAEQINTYTNKKIIEASMIFGGLLLFSIYYFILYYIQKRDRTALYFALFTFVVAVRAGVVNERILVRFIPEMSAELTTKLGYMPVFVLLPLLILYVREIFNSPIIEKVSKITKVALVVIIAVILATPLSFYDLLFQYGQWIIFACALYIIYKVIKEGFFSKIRGAWLMAAGCGVILFTAISDYLRELNLSYLPELLSIGILVFILLQAIFIAWRLNDSYIRAKTLANENKIINWQLQVLNESLENKVIARTEELEQANKRLEQLSRVDSLTGLANRRFFDERIQEKWSCALTEREPLSIIMLDIDYFKQYNDNYGHIKGDNCLRQIATELANAISYGVGFVARYGGEEFVILLANTDAKRATLIAEKIRKRIERLKIEHLLSKVNNNVTISLGVNTIGVSKDVTLEQFINEADQALYLAKEKGRNKVVHVKNAQGS